MHTLHPHRPQVSVQVLINVMGCEGKKVSEILDYGYVDHWEQNKRMTSFANELRNARVITKAEDGHKKLETS